MANEPLSPISDLVARIKQQPPIKANGIPIYPWRKSKALNTAPPRIVLYPTQSALIGATSIPDALCDVDQFMAAECWGTNGESAWALMAWLIQALEGQSAGVPGAPGYYWNLLGADWDTDADTSTQGETVTLRFTVRFSVFAVPFDLSHMGQWPTGGIDSVNPIPSLQGA